jgi:hypothetical protein
MALKGPLKSELDFLRNWLDRPDRGDLFLEGVEAEQWEENSCVDWGPQKTPNDIEIIHASPPVSKLSQRQFDPDTLSIYYIRKGDDPGLWYSLPILEHGFSPGPRSLYDHQLLLEAPTASFNLTGEHQVGMRPLFLRCTEEKHTLCPLAVFSEEGYVAGTVFVDADIAQTLESGAYEVVALSRTTLYRNDEDPAWDDETNTFLLNEAHRKMPHADDEHIFSRGSWIS